MQFKLTKKQLAHNQYCDYIIFLLIQLGNLSESQF